MNPLPELFLEPTVGRGHIGDVALPASHQFSGAVVYYNGRPSRVEFVQAELAAAGVPQRAARRFLFSSEPVTPVTFEGPALGLLGDIGHLVRSMWNPDQHPKGDDGRFVVAGSGGPGGGIVTDTGAVATDPHAQKTLVAIDAALQTSAISGTRGAEYRTSALSVLRAMSPAAVQRLNRNVRDFHFVSQFAQVTPTVRTRMAKLGYPANEVAEIPDGVCGAYIKDDKTLVADGGVPGTRPEEGVHTAGVYAHEWGHALDGPDNELSNSKRWLAAWHDEIENSVTPPSDYAKRSPSEGFAEFHRVLVANRTAALKLYPKCAAVWEKQGLL